MEFDTKKILETPDKEFVKRYNEMKSNYSVESAFKFFEWLKTQTLGLFIRHFREIAAESYYGTNEAIRIINTYRFVIGLDRYRVSEWHDIVTDLIGEVTNKGASEKQIDRYNELLGILLIVKGEDFYRRRSIYTYKNTIVDEFKEHDIEKRAEMIPISEKDENDNNVETTYINTVQVIAKLMIETAMGINKAKADDPFAYPDYNERISIIASALICTLTYIPEFSTITDNMISDFLKEFMVLLDTDNDIKLRFTVEMKRVFSNDRCDIRQLKHISIDPVVYNTLCIITNDRYIGDTEKELRAECCTEDVTHGSRFNAVNDILLDTFEDVDESFSSEKEFIESSVLEMYDVYFNIVKESFMDDIDFNINDYPALPSNVSSYEEAFDFLLEKTNYAYFSEADDVDSAVEKIETNTKHSKPKETLSKKIQNKAMDAEAKQAQKQAKRKEAVGNIAGAVKAVGNIPKNIINDIKEIGKKIDEKDDERRKKFLAKPGFRKHIFKTLKLAILYGSAAQCKLALVPVVALLRHFSKEKDARIWNELQRELDTEIKVTEEKINDASANGDQEAKYKLIRIKEKLEQERDRVKLNSKYI